MRKAFLALALALLLAAGGAAASFISQPEMAGCSGSNC
jgi:hypothetical protein